MIARVGPEYVLADLIALAADAARRFAKHYNRRRSGVGPTVPERR